jgi:hypothetical protein
MSFIPTHIVVVESGWVFAAVLDGVQPGEDIRSSDCAVVRVWGTTNGLGELAIKGPTSETKLDKCNITHIPRGKVLFIMECAPVPWLA